MLYLNLTTGTTNYLVLSTEEDCDPLSSNTVSLVLCGNQRTDSVAAQVYANTVANILRNGGAQVTFTPESGS